MLYENAYLFINYVCFDDCEQEVYYVLKKYNRSEGMCSIKFILDKNQRLSRNGNATYVHRQIKAEQKINK